MMCKFIKTTSNHVVKIFALNAPLQKGVTHASKLAHETHAIFLFVHTPETLLLRPINKFK